METERIALSQRERERLSYTPNLLGDALAELARLFARLRLNLLGITF